MAYIIALAIAALVGGTLHMVFRTLDPARINYHPCEGGWWEGELNGCQNGLQMIPQQPINAYPALMYVAGSVFVALQLRVPPAYVFVVASLYLCVGTAIFHALSTLWSHVLDKSSMYAVCSTLMAYAAFAFLGLDGWRAAILMLGTAILAGYLLAYKFPGADVIKIGAFLGLAYLLTIVRVVRDGYSAATPYLAVSAVLFLLGLACQIMDKKRVFPIKRWGHGIWQLLTGIAIPMLFHAAHLTQ